MANPYDRFDAAQPAPAAPNPYDRFDEPSAPAETTQPSADQPSSAGVFARGAEAGALPAGGGIAGAGAATAALTATGIPAATAAIPVVGPAAAVAEELVAGGAGAYAGAGVVAKAQQWVLEHAPPGIAKALGLDKEQQAADEAAHPNVRFAGELAPNLLAFRPSLGEAAATGEKTLLQKVTQSPVTARAVPAAIMAGQEAAQEEVNNGQIDPAKVGIAAGVGALSNKPTTIGAFLHGAGAGPVMGLSAALRNRGAQPPDAGMVDITPKPDGPAPAGTPRLPAPIEAQDIHPGDEESPIPTSIIAAGRKIIRESTTPVTQTPENNEILSRNGWPQAGSAVTLSDGEGPPVTGVVHSGFNTEVPDQPGVSADGLHVSLDNGQMFLAFKHEMDAAGISITPQQAELAGLPATVAAPAAPAPEQPAPQPTAAPGAVIAPAPSPAPAPSAQPMATLPPDLAGAKPAYAYGSKQFALTFESDIDKAAYIAAQAKPSKRDADYVSFVANATGMTVPEIRAHGAEVRATIKAMAQTAPAGKLTVPEVSTAPQGDGTQAAPITVSHPDHVDLAAARVNTAPTEAEKEAGNYSKGHISLHGLAITIENPAGSIRSGVGADGKRWEVQIPAAYGYIKRTTGADNEQVDAYIGPNPQSKKVFIVDQKDAKTGAFDEHKALIGFDSQDQALATYHAGFSDGLGPQRMGGVREMPVAQFRLLLESGKLDKPLTAPAAPAQTVVKKTARPLGPANNEMSALEYIRRMGGIKTKNAAGQLTKEGQDIHEVMKDVTRVGVINNKSGMQPDYIRENMREHGWFGRNPEAGSGIQDLYDLIRKEAHEGPQFHPESERAKDALAKASADESERAKDEAIQAINAVSREYKEIFTEAEKAAMLDMVAGGLDPESAVAEYVERQAIRDEDQVAKEAPDSGYEEIPFESGLAETGGQTRTSEQRPEGEQTDTGEGGTVRAPPAEVEAPARQGDGEGGQAADVTAPSTDISPSASRVGKFFGSGSKDGTAHPGNEQVGLSADLKRMIDLFGPKMYGADMPQVTAKEILQNSFDGIKAALARGDIKPGEGEIDIRYDRDKRTLSFTDNGAGMTPDIVKDAFLTVAGTNKGDLSEADRSGGFGVAKLAFIFGNDGLKLETVRDGLKTTLDTNSKELLDGKADLRTSSTKDKNGTTVTVTFPKTFLDPRTGQQEQMNLPYDAGSFNALRKPLIGDVGVNVIDGGRFGFGEKKTPLALGRKYDLSALPKVTTAHFTWGDIDLYLAPQQGKYHAQQEVLSSGLFQFSHAVRKPGAWESLPYDLIMDVRPSVAADSALYPFNNQRENFSPKIKPDIDQLEKYIMNFHAAKEAAGSSNSFASLEAMPVTKKLNPSSYSSSFESLGLERHLPERGTAFDLAPDITIKNGQVSIGGKNRNFDAEMAKAVSVQADKFSFPAGTVPTDRPVFHNNLNVDVFGEAEKRFSIPQADSRKFMAELGTIVTDFRDGLAKVPGYEKTSAFPVGLSLDKSYHGVHVQVPYQGFFLNPLSVRATTDTGISRSYLHTLLHEAAHTDAKGHDEGFTIALAKVEEGFEDANPELRFDMERKVLDLIQRQRPVFNALREVYNDPTTANAGKDAEGVERSSDEQGRAGGLSRRPLGGRGERDGSGLRRSGPDGVPEGAGRGDLRGPDEGRLTPRFSTRSSGGLFATEPGTAVDGQGNLVPQTVIPGTETDALQLAAAREAAGKGKSTTSVAQKKPGGLFGDEEPKEPEQGRLFLPSIREPFTPAFNAQRKAVAAELRERLEKMGLHDIAVSLPDTILANDKQVDGYYDLKVITVALDASDPHTSVFDHEAIHAFKALGLFTKSEWSILSAKAAEWRDKYAVDKTWEGLNLDEDGLNEEAIAEAYRHWSADQDRAPPEPKPDLLTRIFNKVRDALAAIRRVLTGRGFETPDEIFGGVKDGDIGSRPRAEQKEGPKFSARGDDSAEPVDEQQAALDRAWDNTIAAAAKHLGWEGEPTSAAMFAKALITPKGPAKTELTRNAGLIKAMEDQRATPFRHVEPPVAGTGETRTRGLSQGMESAATRNGMAGGFGGKPEYDVMDKADQLAKANAFIGRSYEAAKAVAMGHEPPPYGITPEAVLIAVEKRATRESDWSLIKQLATQSALMADATTMGQRISMLTERDPHSPVAAIKAVQAAREGAAERKGVDIRQAKKSTIDAMKASIKKKTDQSAKKITWERFMAEIVCKDR